MTLIILILLFIAYKYFKPDIEWIEESEILIMHYRKGLSRDYMILWRKNRSF